MSAVDDAQLAQVLLARGLVRPEALDWLRAQRTRGDTRPLRRLVVEAGLLSAEVVERVEAGYPGTLVLPTPSGSGSDSRRSPLPGPVPSPSGPGSDSRRSPLPMDASRPPSGPGGPASSRARRAVGPGVELELSGALSVRVERLLGRGGMGEVFLVHDPLLGRRAALKLVRGERRTRVLRFQRETRITARLDHPGIPPVFQSGRTADGADYLLMRFVDGRALDKVLDDLYPWRGRGERSGASLSGEGEPRDLLSALVKVAEAVAYAHAQGVVHRDLKPANLMLGAFGEVLVMDWGLARDLHESEESDLLLREQLLQGPEDPASGGADGARAKLTQDGAVLGTPGYLAPEQATGRDVDARADVFALGSILTEVLCGRPPCVGPAPLEALAQVATGKVASPRQLRPDVPLELDAVARRALCTEPAARYPTAQAFADDLRAWLEGRPVSVYRYGVLRRTVRLVRRNPGPFAVLGTASVLGVAGAVLVTRAEAERRVQVMQASEQAAAAERAQALARARAAAEEAWDAQATASQEATEERLRRAIAALQAAQAWRALDPAEAQAARAQERAALVLGEEATREAQWWLARYAFEQARGLSADEGAVEAGLRRLEEARTAGARQRAAEVEDLLRRARQGELVGAAALQEAEDRLARHADPETVERLTAALEEVTRLLGEARLKAYLAAEEPTSAEARAGERPLRGLREALEARSRAGIRRPHQVTKRADELIAAAERRLMARQVRASPQDATQILSSAREVLALQQAEALGPRRAVARLVVPALGRLGVVEGPAAALTAYLEVEEDQVRATEAALALARLDPGAASEALVGLLLRFGPKSALVERVGRTLGQAPPAQAEEPAGGDQRPQTARELLREAQRLELTGDLEQALARAEQALKLRPRWVEGLCMRAAMLLTRGQAARARQDAEQACTLDPRHGGARFMLGNAAMLEGRLEEACRAFDQALALGVAGDSQLFNNRALCREQLGDVAGALEDLEAGLRIEPGNVGLWVTRGRVRMEHGQPAEGLRDLEHAIGLDPGAHLPRYLRGMQLIRDGQGVEGLRELDRAVELAPREAEYLRARSRACALLGQVDRALVDAARAVALEEAGGGVEAAMWQARLFQNLGRHAEAIAALDAGLARRPDAVQALALRCELHVMQGREEAARADLERLRELAPRDPDDLLTRANAAFRLDELALARSDLEALLARRPHDRNGLNNLGLVLRGLGEREAAVGIYERLLAAQPGDAQAHVNLALILDELGRAQDALRHLDRAVELSPEVARFRSLRAEVRAKAADAPGAAADLEEALRLAPGDPAVWLQRAELRRHAGRLEEARADAERALELGPDPTTRAALEALLEALPRR